MKRRVWRQEAGSHRAPRRSYLGALYSWLFRRCSRTLPLLVMLVGLGSAFIYSSVAGSRAKHMTARALAQEKSMGVRGNEPHASTPEAAGSPITSRTATPVYNGSSSAGMASDVNASSIRRTRSPAAFYLLTVGSCLFGSYIMYCLCCGGISSQYTRVLRRPILSLGGRVINGVDLTELAASAWCICCILAADYLHWKLIAPTTCCVGLSCPSLEWIVIHAVPSAYLNVTFFYNWCMCIFFTRPQDAYTEEQCDRFLKKQQLQSWEQQPSDMEHWSSDSSLYFPTRRGSVAGQSKAGRLGTDGDPDRGRKCSTCRAFVVRSDHHCPFLGTCVGAHNQTYFVGLVIQMTLSMWYGSTVSVYASWSCLSQHSHLEDCASVLYIALAVLFLALALSLFTGAVCFLCCIDVTIREALSIEFLRYKGGPCFFWSTILSQSDTKRNLHGILGPDLWKLLVPFARRPPSVLVSLRLPKDEELEVHGVWWRVDESGAEIWA